MERSTGWLDAWGRIGREEFWLRYVLPLLAIQLAAIGLDLLLPISEAPMLPLGTAALLALPALAGQVKRWHDLDRAGWWWLLNLVPVLGPIATLLALGFLPGTPGPNRFGAAPTPVAAETGREAAGLAAATA